MTDASLILWFRRDLRLADHPMLTAAAATLALIPISREVFWGPMAYAMMGGIIVGTVLTLLFLPALYVAWFRIQPPAAEAKLATPEATATPAEA